MKKNSNVHFVLLRFKTSEELLNLPIGDCRVDFVDTFSKFGEYSEEWHKIANVSHTEDIKGYHIFHSFPLIQIKRSHLRAQ